MDNSQSPTKGKAGKRDMPGIVLTHILLPEEEAYSKIVLSEPGRHLKCCLKPLEPFESWDGSTVGLSYDVAHVKSPDGRHFDVLAVTELGVGRDPHSAKPIRTWLLVDDEDNLVVLEKRRHAQTSSQTLMAEKWYDSMSRLTYVLEAFGKAPYSPEMEVLKVGDAWIDYLQAVAGPKGRRKT